MITGATRDEEENEVMTVLMKPQEPTHGPKAMLSRHITALSLS